MNSPVAKTPRRRSSGSRRRQTAGQADLDTSAPPRGFVPLRTERLTLRPLTSQDAEALHRLVNDWEVTRTLSVVPFPYPRSLADEWIAATAADLAAGIAYTLAITGTEAEAETLVGVVGLRLDRATRVGTLGYWVGQRFWGHGVATEAAGRLVRWALANLPIERIVASVVSDNLASAAVLRRIGFRETGAGRDHFRARGGEFPTVLFEAARDDLAPLPPSPATAIPPSPATAIPPSPATAIPPSSATAIPPQARAETAKPLLLVAACALLDSDGRVLLARRPEGKSMAGLWEFPGGKLAPGETPERALIRELKEELGIDVATACLAPFTFASHEYERFHLLMPLYVCRRWRGRPQPREAQTLAWVRPEKLTDYPMPPADKPLIPLLRDFL